MDAKELFDLLAARRSIRRYTDRSPMRSDIERLIEAACWAPSNRNRQGWKFVVFEDRLVIDELALRVRESVRRTLAASPRAVTEQGEEIIHFAGAFAQAPMFILAMHKKGVTVGRSLLASAVSPLVSGEVLSTAMAVENLLLAAHAAGLGACVMTAPLLAGDVWNGLPDLPPGFEPTCLVTLGYPAESPQAPPRKPLRHVLEYRDRR